MNKDLIEKYRSTVEIQPKDKQKKSIIPPDLLQKKCFSSSDLAHWLGISIRSVERMLKRGEIRYKKVGRRVVIPVSAVEAWLNDEGSP